MTTLCNVHLSLVGVISIAFAAGVYAQTQDNPTTPGGRYQALLREFQSAAYSYFQSDVGEERKQITTRIATLTSQCLEVVERHPSESFALDALTQVVTQEYWLDNYTSFPG